MRPLLDRPLRRALLAAALIHGAGAGTAAASLPAALLAGIDPEEWVWRHHDRWHDRCFAYYYDPACPLNAAGPVQLFVPPPITRVVRREDSRPRVWPAHPAG